MAMNLKTVTNLSRLESGSKVLASLKKHAAAIASSGKKGLLPVLILVPALVIFVGGDNSFLKALTRYVPATAGRQAAPANAATATPSPAEKPSTDHNSGILKCKSLEKKEKKCPKTLAKNPDGQLACVKFIKAPEDLRKELGRQIVITGRSPVTIGLPSAAQLRAVAASLRINEAQHAGNTFIPESIPGYIVPRVAIGALRSVKITTSY